MELLEALKRKINSAEELHSLVKTMKALAAVSIREHEQAVGSLKEYHKTVEMGFQILLQNRPDVEVFRSRQLEKNRLCAIIFGSERGMCGQFNEKICAYSIDRMNKLEIKPQDRTVFALGDRVITRIEEAGQQIEKRFSIFGSNIGFTLQEVLINIEELRLKKDIDQIVLFYNKPATGTSFNPNMVYLLPFDPEWIKTLSGKKWPSRTLPAYTMEWESLYTSLTRQYLFFSLYRAFVESIASENASRLASMQVAEKNIEDRLRELHTGFNLQRQTSITSELLDIMTGFEALMG
ncbi:MAG: F0F1 ATP synthase subunit gamma [Candidatus Methanoperedens sp.]|nr:F0F1 ATP synthase subunit gamma [Candidatus Methanoperedens sp.]